MIRIDPSHWTADFRIARALTEAFSASGRGDVLFVCVGDPGDVTGRLGPIVGDETRKYYPNVLGTTDAPITNETLSAFFEQVRTAGEGKFIVAVEAGMGPLEHLGSIEVTDREPRLFSGREEPLFPFGGVTVSVILIPRPPSRHASPEQGVPGAAGPVPAPVPDPAQARGSTQAGSPSGRGLSEASREVGSDDEHFPDGRRSRFKPLRPDRIDARIVQKLADTVIDGNLRFLSKIGKQEI